MGKIEARKSRRSRRMTKTKATGKQNKHFRKQPTIANPIIEAKWDKTKTVKENYDRLGLATSLSADIAARPRAALDDEEGETMDLSAVRELNKKPLIQELEEYSKTEVKKETHQAAGEVAFVKALIAKHGTDYKAMAKDTKLNKYQHTPKVLQRKCETYIKSVDAAADS